MTAQSDRDYDELYRDTTETPPWEIGGPQPALVPLLESEVRGPKVLDLGCGTGELAIALARRGYDVTGVDFSPVAIERARAKAAGLPNAHFEVQDATSLSLPAAPFDSLFDSGLLHNLSRIGGTAAADYLAQLPGLAAPGAALFLLGVSAEAGGDWNLTAEGLAALFPGDTWTGTTVEPTLITAQVADEVLSLPGLLLRTTRCHGPAPGGAQSM